MSNLTRRPASRRALHVRAAIDGPPGAGKTFGALLFARGLVGSDGRICVIDTERGRSEQYAGLVGIGEFGVIELAPPHTPRRYVEAIGAAVQAGDEVVIIDSLTHSWTGTGGVLDQVNQIQGNQKSKYTAWAAPSAEHQRLMDAVAQCPVHIIATMRTKMEYALVNGRPERLGLAPVQREGTEYEFDIVLDVDQQTHNVRLGKCNTSYSQALSDYLASYPRLTVAHGEMVRAHIQGVIVPNAHAEGADAITAKKVQVADWIGNHLDNADQAATIQILTECLDVAADMSAIRAVYEEARTHASR